MGVYRTAVHDRLEVPARVRLPFERTRFDLGVIGDTNGIDDNEAILDFGIGRDATQIIGGNDTDSAAPNCCSSVPGARSCANGTFCEPVPASGRRHFERPLSALRSRRILRVVCSVVPMSARCERDQGRWLG